MIEKVVAVVLSLKLHGCTAQDAAVTLADYRNTFVTDEGQEFEILDATVLFPRNGIGTT